MTRACAFASPLHGDHGRPSTFISNDEHEFVHSGLLLETNLVGKMHMTIMRSCAFERWR